MANDSFSVKNLDEEKAYYSNVVNLGTGASHSSFETKPKPFSLSLAKRK